MSITKYFFSPQLIEAIGWTLFHSIWIGGAIYSVLIITFSSPNGISSRKRYFISFYSLLLLFLLSLVCFITVYTQNTSSILTSNSGETIITNNVPELAQQPSDYGISSIPVELKSFFTHNFDKAVFVWTLGVIGMIFYYSCLFLYTFSLKHRGLYQPDPVFENQFRSVSRKIKLVKNVKIFESASAKIPMAVGYFKPVILFPLGFLSGLPPKQVEVIILHELIHISRADFLSKLLQSAVEIFLFINPFVWFISNKVNQERENSCDDAVLDHFPDPMIYAHALLSSGSHSFSQLQLAQTLTGNKKLLLRRIKRMFNKNNETKQYRNLTSFSFLVLFTLIFYIMSYSEQKKNYASPEIDGLAIQEANFGGGYFVNPMPLLKEYQLSDTSSETSEKALSFNAEFEGINSEWKVIFKEGKISSIYRDGNQIPENEIKNYEDFIYEELAELNSGYFPRLSDKYDLHRDKLNDNIRHLKEKLRGHKIFSPEFNKHLQMKMEKMRGKIDSLHLEEFHIEFDSVAFNEQMKELQEHLNDFKFEGKFNFDFDFDFDSSGFKEQMEELEEQLQKMGNKNKINLKKFQFQFDQEKEKALQETLQRIVDQEFINEHVEANLKQLEKEMANFELHLNDLKPDLESLNKEMATLELYVQEIKTELVKDGLLKNEREKADLRFDEGEIYIDGKKIPDSLTPKYKAIHDKYFENES